MCGESSLANQNLTIVSTQPIIYTAEMRFIDYFFMDPLFIIGMLVLFVIIVIIVSWWLQRRKSLAEGRDLATGDDVEKDQQNLRRQDHQSSTTKVRTVEISEKNLEVLEGLLSTVGGTDGETDSLLENGKVKKQTTFGTETTILGDNSEVSIEIEPIEGLNPADNLATIIPDLDFREFPKTEEDRKKMRRANMKKMLSLSPI